MKHFGRQALIIAIALILGIGQACACLPAAGATGSHHGAAQSPHAPAAHVDHAGHGGHDDHADRQPCDDACPHCADSFVVTIKAQGAIVTLPIPSSPAILAAPAAQAHPPTPFVARRHLARPWRGPPGETPVSLKTVLRV